MKKLLTLLLCLTMILACFYTVGCGTKTEGGSSGSSSSDSTVTENIPEWKEDGVMNILTIGNSFSEDTTRYLYQIASDLGVEEIFIGNLVIAGCSVATHLSNAIGEKPAYTYMTNSTGEWSAVTGKTLNEVVASKKWDYISIQQASPDSGNPRTYDDVELLAAVVKEMCMEAKMVWNMTWAYQSDSTHSGFGRYQNDQTVMYNAIVSAVKTYVVPNQMIPIVAATGTAVQNARTSYLGDNITRDGYHLSYDVGRFIAGVAFFHCVTGIDVSGLTYAPDGVGANVLKVAIESALNAGIKPFEVTQSVNV